MSRKLYENSFFLSPHMRGNGCMVTSLKQWRWRVFNDNEVWCTEVEFVSGGGGGEKKKTRQ